MAILELGISAVRARQGAQQFTAATRQVQAGAAGAAASVTAMQATMASSGRAAVLAGASMRRFLAPLIGIAGLLSAGRTIAAFELQLRQLGQVSGATAEEMQHLEEQSRRLGATTQFTAAQAAKAQLEFARAGFSTREILEATGPTLNLAVAGFLGLSDAAKLTGDTLGQFVLATSEAGRVSDALVAAANNSKTTVNELGEALKDAGPVARTFGSDLEQTLGALAALGESGFRGGRAGVAIRQILTTLGELSAGNVSDQQRVALQRLGLTVSDISLRTKTLVEVFRTLREAGLESETAVGLFDKRTVAAAVTLATFADKGAEVEAVLRDAYGVAAANASAVTDTLTGDFKALISSFQEFALAAGDGGMRGVLRRLTQGVTTFVRAASGIPPSMDKATDSLSAWDRLVGAAGTKLNDFGAMLTTIGDGGAQAFGNIEDSLHRVVQGMEEAETKANDFFSVWRRNTSQDAEGRRLAEEAEEAVRAMVEGAQAIERQNDLVRRMQAADVSPADLFREQMESGLDAERSLERLIKARAEAVTAPALPRVGEAESAADRVVRDLEFEIKLARSAIGEREKLHALRQAGVAEGSEEALKIRELVTELQRLDKVNAVIDGAAASFTDFLAVLRDTGDEKQALESLTRSLSDLGLQVFVFDNLRNLLRGAAGGLGALGSTGGGSPSAANKAIISGSFGKVSSRLGNVFSNDTMVPFRLGGLPDILTQPVAFPLAGGRRGLAGEAGPEAIMPLRRGPGGRLGVEAGAIDFGPVIGELRRIHATLERQRGTSFRSTLRQEMAPPTRRSR